MINQELIDKQETKYKMEQRLFEDLNFHLKFVDNVDVPIRQCEEIETFIPEKMKKTELSIYVSNKFNSDDIFLRHYSGVNIGKKLSYFIVRILPEHLESVLDVNSYFKGLDDDGNFWENIIDNIIRIQLENNYKNGWVVNKLTAIYYLTRPTSLEYKDLLYLADELGYKQGWAYFLSKKLNL